MLFCPTLPHADMFYLRQLASFNYAVYYGATGKCDMVFWTELEGSRGVDEIVSAIMRSLTASIVPLLPGQTRTLVMWSDRCVGQTNNWPMICAMINLVSLGYFTSIEQKFLVSGHTFLPCDRCFGRVEARKKSCMVYTPDDWIDVILSAQPNNPFRVLRQFQPDIRGYKDAYQYLQKPVDLNVTKVAWILYEHLQPAQLLTRETHVPTIWRSHTLHNPNQSGVRYNRRLPFNLQSFNVQPSQKYVAPLVLSNEKKHDLRETMKFLEPQHQAYYLNHI